MRNPPSTLFEQCAHLYVSVCICMYLYLCVRMVCLTVVCACTRMYLYCSCMYCPFMCMYCMYCMYDVSILAVCVCIACIGPEKHWCCQNSTERHGVSGLATRRPHSRQSWTGAQPLYSAFADLPPRPVLAHPRAQYGSGGGPKQTLDVPNRPHVRGPPTMSPLHPHSR